MFQNGICHALSIDDLLELGKRQLCEKMKMEFVKFKSHGGSDEKNTC